MKNRIKKADVSIIAPLLTLIVFSVCVLFVLLFGARLYKEALARDKESFEKRTADQYIATRFRQADGDQFSFVADFEDSDANDAGDTLFFVEKVGDEIYFTRIYCHDGYLCELFSSADDVFERDDGERILPLESLYFEEKDGLFRVTVEHIDGRKDKLLLAKRSEIGGNYEK